MGAARFYITESLTFKSSLKDQSDFFTQHPLAAIQIKIEDKRFHKSRLHIQLTIKFLSFALIESSSPAFGSNTIHANCMKKHDRILRIVKIRFFTTYHPFQTYPSPISIQCDPRTCTKVRSPFHGPAHATSIATLLSVTNCQGYKPNERRCSSFGQLLPIISSRQFFFFHSFFSISIKPRVHPLSGSV